MAKYKRTLTMDTVYNLKPGYVLYGVGGRECEVVEVQEGERNGFYTSYKGEDGATNLKNRSKIVMTFYKYAKNG